MVYNPKPLALDKKRHDAAATLGKILFNQGDNAEAIKYFRRAVQFAPGKADYRIALGDALYKQSQFTEAKQHYTKAKQLGHSKAESRLEKVGSKTG